MASEQPEIIPSSTIDVTPSISNDLMNTFLTTLITITIWIILAIAVNFLIETFGWLFGLIIIFVALYFFVIPLTAFVISRWLEILAYNAASRRTSVPYMNYQKKCPFLQRKRLTFSCIAEQIIPFELSIFEKCHKEPMWEACWPERIPSILEVYDVAPDTQAALRKTSLEKTRFDFLRYSKQDLAFILAGMKEVAAPAGMKMYEALTNDSLDPGARVAAGYALKEMNNESGIEPLIAMVSQYDQQMDRYIRAIIVRYGEMAIPYLIGAINNCVTDFKCNEGREKCECVCVCGLVDVLGKIGHADSIPVLKSVLISDTAVEYTKLQTIYALQEMNNEESFKILIEYLEKAPDEEQTVIKQVCLSRNLISFPLLIDLLSKPEISEDYYTRIGDILADVDASTYDRFFTKLGELQGIETVRRLATILKENTPDEEEFLRIHEVFTKHLTYPRSSANSSD